MPKRVENLASKIQSLRESRGLKRRELAERCGVKYHYIHAIENGHRTMLSVPFISRLAVALNVKPALIFGYVLANNSDGKPLSAR